MFIEMATPITHDTPREVKVRLPPELRVKLHQIKLLTGQPVSETVRLALEQYLASYRFGKAQQHQN